MNYYIFYRGLASCPFGIGLFCTTTNEVVCYIETAMPTGKQSRQKFDRMRKKLNDKYSILLT